MPLIKQTLHCKICGEIITFYTYEILQNHLNIHEISIEDYVKQYEPEKGTGTCLICGKSTKFHNYRLGFSTYCSAKCAQNDPATREKIKKTNLERYGTKTPAENKSILEKMQKTCYEKYGTASPLSNKECIEKRKATNLERYGVENIGASFEICEKRKATNLERYGVENVFSSSATKEKIKQTMLEQYGVEHGSYSEEIIKKRVHTRKLNHYEIYKELLLKLKHIELLETKEEYMTTDIHRYKCHIHNEYFESKHVFYQDVFCPKCYSSRTSFKEKGLSEWLSQYIEVKNNVRKIIGSKEIDIFLPSKSIGIEFDGIYWHSNKFVKEDYHLNKTENAESQGIQLIHVFENEWASKQPIVKSIILSKLGIYDTKIYARNCILRELNGQEYKQFIELNHIQGYAPAKYKYGLFYNNELIMCCGVGNSRFSSNEFELIRLCTKINTLVIGGFSKLITNFLKVHSNIESLISYCDRRYSNGSGYINAGWELESKTKPNYYYVINGVLKNRITYQKHKLKTILEEYDESLTEQENMILNGYYWIYDCGMLKMRLRNKYYENKK